MKIGNYNLSYLESAMSAEGCSDMWNIDATKLKSETNIVTSRKVGATDEKNKDNEDVEQYEFIIIPNIGFLSGSDPLLKDLTLKLKFDRADTKIALINIVDQDDANLPDVLEITNAVATTEWVSSPALRSYLVNDSSPFVYSYEDVDVKTFDLPVNRLSFRLENVYGGNLPLYIFAGIIETDALVGDTSKSSTKFMCHDVSEFNIMVNGSSVNGYPIKLNGTSPIAPYHRFLDTTHRMCNLDSGESINIPEFKYNWLWSHKFEAEGTEGFISLSCNLKQAYTTNMTMVVWTVYPYAVSIDKFNQIEKIML